MPRANAIIKHYKLSLILFLIVWGIILFYWLPLATSIKGTSKVFVTALVEGDIEKAKDKANGQVLLNLNREKNAQSSKLIDLKLNLKNSSKEWGTVRAMIETENSSGENDVQWYTLSLHKKDDEGWKVYHIKTDSPHLKGLRAWAKKQDRNGSLEVLESYLRTLASNQYEKAASYLVGPAKTSHLASSQILAQAPIIEQIGDIAYEPLWKKGNFLLVQAKYLADNRDVKIIALFYKTDKGWKIADIKPV